MEYIKHPSYGYATPEEIEKLKEAGLGSDDAACENLMKTIKARGNPYRAKKKKVVTNIMFSAQTDGKMNE